MKTATLEVAVGVARRLAPPRQVSLEVSREGLDTLNEKCRFRPLQYQISSLRQPSESIELNRGPIFVLFHQMIYRVGDEEGCNRQREKASSSRKKISVNVQCDDAETLKQPEKHRGGKPSNLNESRPWPCLISGRPQAIGCSRER